MSLEFFSKIIEGLQEQDAYREIQSMIPIDAAHVTDSRDNSGRIYTVMNSNNYLGLTHHPRVQQAAKEALLRYGTGSGGARLTSGAYPLQLELEEELARFKGAEKALVFNTGYMANVGILSSIAGTGDYIFSDALNHASIVDGCRLSRATTVVFPHKDMRCLELELAKVKDRPGIKLIVTDGVFSMDGDIAPLPDICALARKYGALVMVDDAHATGVIGRGRGTAHYWHCESAVDLQVGTLSKALASEGGFVAGSSVLVNYLINKARSFIFSTALAPATMAAALAALRCLEENPIYIQRLQDNQGYMNQLFKQAGMGMTSETPIFPIIVRKNHIALRLSRALYDAGFIVSAIRPPTVAPDASRLRLTVTAAHTKEELSKVVEVLKTQLECCKESSN